MSTTTVAVITADIVNSTALPKKQAKQLNHQLEALLLPYQYEFYRGDSFQVLVPDPAEALTIGLQCRSLAIAFSPKDDEKHTDIRLSIGIGKSPLPVSKLGAASGEAFLLSGRAFDALEKSDKRLSITVSNPLASTALAVVADYADAVFAQLTVNQARLYQLMFTGATQLEAAATLKKSKSTVHQYVVSGKWYETERILYHYREIVKHIL
ncbi:hypothetical protein [Flavihumibacter petaseus]|uniref:SatD family protein n=1 Tax=Flavihumibacter petaseus NBRC 106054 TaxID=1220578 RepID=A0A0E9N447_9BACT|nr:hypothetical protein [Flavihumibacter petaseus]GAO44599.1 hypothetical protein FPE01S_03_06370 [Flavihumibacter petaseus NBRC 106054]